MRTEVAGAGVVEHPGEDLVDGAACGVGGGEQLPLVLVVPGRGEAAGQHGVDDVLGRGADLAVRLRVADAAGLDGGGDHHAGQVHLRLAGGAVDRLADPCEHLGVPAEEVLGARAADVDEVGAVGHDDDLVAADASVAGVAAGRVEVVADLYGVVDGEDEAGVDGGEVDDGDRGVVAEGEVAGGGEGEDPLGGVVVGLGDPHQV